MQWLMLQQDQPDDFVIATGVQYSVRQFIEMSAAELGITIRWDGQGVDERGWWDPSSATPPPAELQGPIVAIDPRYFRPTEVETLLGDPSKARDKLGWQPEITLADMIKEMVAHDLEQARKVALLNQHGYAVKLRTE
jgi:GDPmannose 4,6-dehydratase